MQWAEGRIYQLERKTDLLQRQLDKLTIDVRALQQALKAIQQQGGGGGGGEVGAFWIAPSTVIPGGSSSVAETINQTVGGVSSVVGGFPVYNVYAADIVAGNVTIVEPDGGGGFVAVAQSCT